MNGKKKRTVPIINIFFKFLIFFNHTFIGASLSKNLNTYLEMDFEEKQKIKTGKLFINDSDFDISIKSGYLCLFLTDECKNNFYQIVEKPLGECKCCCCCCCKKFGKYLAFKEILINKIINEYIYILLENPLITDQLPLANTGYELLLILFYNIFEHLLIISILFSKLSIKNDKVYNDLVVKYANENLKFYKTFKSYGKFQKNTMITRIIYDAIAICLLFIVVIIRLIKGGFRNINCIKSLLILSIFLSLIYVIDCVLAFLSFLFSIFSAVCLKDEPFEPTNWKLKLLINCFLYMAIFIDDILVMLRFSINSVIYYFDIIKRRKKINKTISNTDLNQEIIFDYIGLDNNNKKLNEFRIQGFPKYLFFKPDVDIQGNNNENNETYNNLNTENNIIVNIYNKN